MAAAGSRANVGASITNSVTPDVNDRFAYKVTDTRGCIALGTIFVQVILNETGQGTSVTVSNGIATVGFAGIPGRSYQVQRSTNLADWATLVTRRTKKDLPENGGWNAFITIWGGVDASSPITYSPLTGNGASFAQHEKVGAAAETSERGAIR